MTGPADRYALTRHEIDDIFAEIVLPTLQGTPRDQPVAIWLGGQPASGKTTVQGAILDALGRDDVITVDGDDYFALHPRYFEALASDDEEALDHIGDFSAEIWNRVMAHIRDHHLDVAISSPLANRGWAAGQLAESRERGYRNITAYLAVHGALSSLGLVDRDLQGVGLDISTDIHNWLYVGAPETAEHLEARRLADEEYVFNRRVEIVHANVLGPDRQWQQPPRIRAEIELGRARSVADEQAVHEYGRALSARLPEDRRPAVTSALALLPGADPSSRPHGMLTDSELSDQIDAQANLVRPFQTEHEQAEEHLAALKKTSATVDEITQAQQRVNDLRKRLRKESKPLDSLRFERQLRVERHRGAWERNNPPHPASAASAGLGQAAQAASAAFLAPSTSSGAPATPPRSPTSSPQRPPPTNRPQQRTDGPHRSR